MQLKNTRITIEENDERLKMTLPVTRNSLAIGIYTVLAAIWLVGLILFVYLLLNPPVPRDIVSLPLQLAITWAVLVLFWLYLWIRYIGRLIMRWWQYYLADREILFFHDKSLILRRPVSILGLTDAYNKEHVSAFMLDEKHSSLTFRYGNVQHILFGATLSAEEQLIVRDYVNERYFPYYDDEEDDEE
ncbi:MAG: hypothetical protein ACPG8W_14985 [Candidatus Promineifilaceae bacterium]